MHLASRKKQTNRVVTQATKIVHADRKLAENVKILGSFMKRSVK